MDLRLLEGQGHLRPLQGAGPEIPLDLAVAMRAALPRQRPRREEVHPDQLVWAVPERTDGFLELEEGIRARTSCWESRSYGAPASRWN